MIINGLTKEEYAAKVADLCASAVSMRDMKLHRPKPVTQMVTISMPKAPAYDWFPWIGHREGIIDGPVIKLYVYKLGGESDCSIRIPFDGSKSIRDTIYDGFCEILSDAVDYDVELSPVEYPVFMFLTRIKCAHYENPVDVQREYIQYIERKFGMTLPAEFVIVSPDIMNPDFHTDVKFVADRTTRPLKAKHYR